ncbi:beta-glucosidase [Annulohypoxylon maeteangense]|uniref:beta-glucosidase n=1 Tax=Annulohypoxylon maeteangense TaxID=1927788 RepID=UPI0020085396|nr:beta-glucosidase [Annulohypoxylon maeteangense]KAI0886969.1 beta-glucosidase [Annulohypoxylon maeteangense]
MDIGDTLSKLTLDEKIELISGADFWCTKAVPRLGIPSLRMSDGPNGVRGSRLFNGVPAACTPCGTGLAATWDVDAIRTIGQMMGTEAIAKGASLLLGPTVNIQRSPLGGRGFESFSEDPVLSGKMASSIVQGIQSTGVVSVIKHFVGNDQEEQRQKSDSIIPERALREVYLLPFQIAEKEARPKGYMTAYNRVNGIHVSENPRFLQEILRDEWGFDGIIVSDWYGTYSVAEPINAGLDIDMPGPTRWRAGLAKLSVNSSKVSKRALDQRIRAILKTVDRVASLKLEENVTEGTVDTPETAKKLLDVASSAIVLLKNDRNVLPLDKGRTTAIIGPNAKFAAYSGGGSASLRPYYVVTPFDGVQTHIQSLKYALGATAYKKLPMLTSITKAPNGAPGMEMRIYAEPHSVKDRIPIEKFNIDNSSCFLNDYKHPNIPSNLFYVEVEGAITPEIDAEYLFSLTVNGSGRLYVDGEEVVDNETTQRPGDSFFGSGTAEEIGSKHLVRGQKYNVLVQFGTAPTSKIAKGGATQMGVGGLQIGGCAKTDPTVLLEEAVAVAQSVDQVILCVGLNSEWESEGWDRANMDLPPGSDALVEAITAANPNVVVVNQSGTPVTMPWVEKVPAIVHAWYGGNETGNAIANVLFGVTNPSGKLPLSWPVRLEDNPAFINTRIDGGKVLYGEGVHVGYRWYEKIKRDPLFAFGYGLSYTQFKLENLAINDNPEDSSDAATVTISIDATNIGSQDGSEVVQVYVAHQTTTVQRPLKELKGFSKVHLSTGETKSVTIQLDKKYACSFWDESADSWVLEQGTYHVLVGNSSQNTTLQGQFEVQQTRLWNGL